MLNHTSGFVVWCYVPNDNGDGWEPPHVCQPVIGEIDGDVFATAADAHSCATILRQHYHGHLFAVLHTSQTPKLAS